MNFWALNNICDVTYLLAYCKKRLRVSVQFVRCVIWRRSDLLFNVRKILLLPFLSVPEIFNFFEFWRSVSRIIFDAVIDCGKIRVALCIDRQWCVFEWRLRWIWQFEGVICHLTWITTRQRIFYYRCERDIRSAIERYDELHFNRILKTNQSLFSVISLFQIE